MRYYGTEIEPRIGDTVRFESETDLLVVEQVIDSDAEMKQWGLDQPGLMLKGGVHGRVFHLGGDPELKLVYPSTTHNQKDNRAE